jgi:hypothetical protein
MKNIGPSSRGAVIDQVFSSGKAFHPGSDALRSLPRTGMFAEQPETVTDLVDDTVCDLQTRAFRPIGKNLFEIALRRRYMQHLQKNGGVCQLLPFGNSPRLLSPPSLPCKGIPTFKLANFQRCLRSCLSFVVFCTKSVSHLFCNQRLPHSFSKMPGYNRKFLKDYLKSIGAEPPLRL